jgi:hypothetical protein
VVGLTVLKACRSVPASISPSCYQVGCVNDPKQRAVNEEFLVVISTNLLVKEYIERCVGG